MALKSEPDEDCERLEKDSTDARRDWGPGNAGGTGEDEFGQIKKKSPKIKSAGHFKKQKFKRGDFHAKPFSDFCCRSLVFRRTDFEFERAMRNRRSMETDRSDMMV